MRLAEQEQILNWYKDKVEPCEMVGTKAIKFKEDNYTVVDYRNFFIHKQKLERENRWLKNKK